MGDARRDYVVTVLVCEASTLTLGATRAERNAALDTATRAAKARVAALIGDVGAATMVRMADPHVSVCSLDTIFPIIVAHTTADGASAVRRLDGVLSVVVSPETAIARDR